jgi:hypothetical protein
MRARESTPAVNRPQTDEYPEQLEGVLDALVDSGREAAKEALAPISYPTREFVARSEPSETVIARIYIRDRFHCRYCGCRVIPTQVMRLVAAIFPEDFPYHPNWDPARRDVGARRQRYAPALTSPHWWSRLEE